jgi:hypothetical protein
LRLQKKLTNSFSDSPFYPDWQVEFLYGVQQPDEELPDRLNYPDQQFPDGLNYPDQELPGRLGYPNQEFSGRLEHPDQLFWDSLDPALKLEDTVERPEQWPEFIHRLDPNLQLRNRFTHLAAMPAAITNGDESDVHMINDDNNDLPTEEDDNVTEYSFTSEDYPHESELEDSDEDDARSHISLSSTDEPEVSPVHDVVWKDLTPTQRVSYERMFGTLSQQPLNGSWSFTEDYQAELDQSCIKYSKVYNLEEWLIPPHEAQAVFDGVLERLRKRAAGVLIFAPSVNMGQPRQQPFPFAPHQHHQQQQQHYYQQQQHQQQFQNGGMLMGMHPGPSRGMTYMPPQGQPGMPRQLMMNDPNNRGFKNAPPTMITRPPLKAPTPPYPTRARPDFRKTVGKSAGRGGKTRRQAETDEFPWNRQIDFIKARDSMKADATWDYSVYDKTTLDDMARTRARNALVFAKLEKGITMKQSTLLHVPPDLSCHPLTTY